MRLNSYETRDFELNDTQHMVCTMCADNLSRFSNFKLITGREIDTQATGRNGRSVQCDYRIGVEHLLQNCSAFKAKEYRYGLVTTFNLNKVNTHFAT